METSKITFVGISDVVGGRLWSCVDPYCFSNKVWFYTKKECEFYIRNTFTGNTKKTLLSQLAKAKGRVKIYA